MSITWVKWWVLKSHKQANRLWWCLSFSNTFLTHIVLCCTDMLIPCVMEVHVSYITLLYRLSLHFQHMYITYYCHAHTLYSTCFIYDCTTSLDIQMQGSKSSLYSHSHWQSLIPIVVLFPVCVGNVGNLGEHRQEVPSLHFLLSWSADKHSGTSALTPFIIHHKREGVSILDSQCCKLPMQVFSTVVASYAK